MLEMLLQPLFQFLFSHETRIVPHVPNDWPKRCVGADDSHEPGVEMCGNR